MTATRFQIDPGRETQRRRGRQRKEGISSVPWPSGSGCWGQTTPTRPEPHRLTSQLEAQGYLAAARTLCERALAIQERVVGPDHPDPASSLVSLALLLWKQRELAAARTLCERALAIQEQVLGPDHPDTATGLNDLAFLL